MQKVLRNSVVRRIVFVKTVIDELANLNKCQNSKGWCNEIKSSWRLYKAYIRGMRELGCEIKNVREINHWIEVAKFAYWLIQAVNMRDSFGTILHWFQKLREEFGKLETKSLMGINFKQDFALRKLLKFFKAE